MKSYLVLFGICVTSVGFPQNLKVKEISGGYNHTCAVLLDGTVKCWGDGRFGQLGIGTFGKAFSLPQTALTQEDVRLEGVASISSHDNRSCALTNGGEVYCWGHHYDAVTDWTAFGSSGSWKKFASKIEAPVKFTQLKMGENYSCAIAENQNVYCWGDRLKFSSIKGAVTSPVKLPIDAKIKDMALGNAHACFITTQNKIICSGYNSLAQVAPKEVCEVVLYLDPDEPDKETKVDSGCIGKYVDVTSYFELGRNPRLDRIYAGMNHSCITFFNNDGKEFRCWGYDEYDQLGKLSNLVMPPKSLGGPLERVDDAVLLEGNTCGLSEGKVYCVGDTIVGQTGTGSFRGQFTSNNTGSDQTQSEPLMVQGLDQVVKLGAGEKHICAILEDATVKCWGYGTLGQLGYGGIRSLNSAREYVVAPEAIAR